MPSAAARFAAVGQHMLEVVSLQLDFLLLRALAEQQMRCQVNTWRWHRQEAKQLSYYLFSLLSLCYPVLKFWHVLVQMSTARFCLAQQQTRICAAMFCPIQGDV